MKKLYILSLMLFVFAALQGQTATSYVNNSVLSNGKFIKIKIKESGIYKLTYDDLRKMNIVPEKVRIFGYGGAVIDQNFANASPDDLPEVAIWQGNDYILFYAQGIVKWTYNLANKMFMHEGNPYSTAGYYFVTSDVGEGKKIAVAPTETPTSNIQEITEFTDFQVYEEDEVSLINSGKEFYGEKFDTQTSYSFTFNFPNALSSAPAKMRIAYATSADVISSMKILLNNSWDTTITTNASAGEQKYIEKIATINSIPALQANSVIEMNYLKQPNSTWTAYLNYLEFNVRCSLKMTGSQMRFQNFDATVSDFNKYNLSNANNNIIIWDISDYANIVQMPTERSGQNLSFTTSAENKYFVAFDHTADFPKPETVGTVANQNLHALTDVDLTMIVYPSFLEEANTLAVAHRTIDGMTVAVVTPEQVYNEFSSGTPDISAYRKLMRMQYERDSANHRPKYLLLFGRGSFDNRGLLRETSGNNLILTYQSNNSGHTINSYVTDDYIGMMVDNAIDAQISGNKIAIATGRFPVINQEQAQSVVNKTIEYMTNQRRTIWKNQLVYLADDGEPADGIGYKFYMQGQENISNLVFSEYPEYQINKIYIDAFRQVSSASGDTYPDAKAKLLGLINSGVLFFNYLGHAGSNGLTGEGVLLADDIKKLTNKNYFLCFAGTCDFIHFDVPRISAGEFLLTNPVGGAIGVLSASRTVYGGDNERLSTYFNNVLFAKENGKHNTVGQALILAKNSFINNNLNKLSYVYMGDPAVTLNFPDKYNIKTTEINGNAELTGNDTLKALSINTVKGIIVDNNNVKAVNFNGNIFINIYDKNQTINTLGNDPYSAGTTFNFSDRPNMIYSGKTNVTDGEFEVIFMMPKDINYSFGTGRINYYAEMDSLNEAQGYFEDFIVGGSSDIQITDTEGPVIENIYLNSSSFKNGDKVNETPYFVVRVSDEYGINTIGNGIGHDATLMLNNDPQQLFILNEYFTADFGTYKSGTFAYLMPELPDGKHSLRFKVWDLLNNSAEAHIDFEVQRGLKPQIFELYNFPNPATDYTVFRIVTDRPQDVLQAKIEIFDLVGRKIWEFGQTTTDDIRWDMRSSNGTILLSGIYIYRLTLSTLNSETSYKSNKLIIKKQ